MPNKSISPVAAVTFDIGGTLIEPWPSVGHVYAQVAAEHGCPGLPPEQITARFANAWQAEPDFNHSRTGWRSIVGRTLEPWVPEARLDPLFADLYERFARPEVWRVFDDVEPTLRALRADGLKLGVISNWDERLRPLLDRLGLAKWFDGIIVSQEVGATKPAPAIFACATQALGMPPETVLHVGDRVEEDLRGAQAAGLQALLLDRGAANSWGLSTLRSLPAALAALRLNSPAD